MAVAPVAQLAEQAGQGGRNALFHTHSFRPYYSPSELQLLVHEQAIAKGENAKPYSDSRIEGWRQLACGLVERVGSRLGFPRRTIATAQTLYHRFHLYFPLRDFAYPDVCISAILVAAKLEDTLKKLREIQIAAWQIGNLLEGGPGVGEGDTAAQEQHRPRLIAIERLILQTICFNFQLHRSTVVLGGQDGGQRGVGTRDVFTWVVRLASALGATKEFTYLAHLLAIDVHRTLTPLSYPPHTIAASCLWLASFLSPEHSNALSWKGDDTAQARANSIVFEDKWCEQWECSQEDVEEIAHSLLNLFISLCPPLLHASNNAHSHAQNPSPTFSPLSQTSPAEVAPSLAASSSSASHLREKEKQLLQTGVPHSLSGTVVLAARTKEEFTMVKIRLRELAEARRPKRTAEGGSEAVSPARKRWKGEETETEFQQNGVGGPKMGEKIRDKKDKPISVQYMF